MEGKKVVDKFFQDAGMVSHTVGTIPDDVKPENLGGGGHTAPSIVENMIAAETPEVVKPEPVPQSCNSCGETFEKGWRAVSAHKRFKPCPAKS